MFVPNVETGENWAKKAADRRKRTAGRQLFAGRKR